MQASFPHVDSPPFSRWPYRPAHLSGCKEDKGHEGWCEHAAPWVTALQTLADCMCAHSATTGMPRHNGKATGAPPEATAAATTAPRAPW